MLKTKYMKHYTSHKTMNLQSMHILLQNILKKALLIQITETQYLQCQSEITVKEMGCCVGVVYHVDESLLVPVFE